jgi:hypothetical protein
MYTIQAQRIQESNNILPRLFTRITNVLGHRVQFYTVKGTQGILDFTVFGYIKKWHFALSVVDVFNYTRKSRHGKGFLITHENGQDFDWFRLHPGIVV